MIEYSHRNTLTFGYGDGVLNESDGTPLSYTMQRCSREPLPLKDELIETAKLMQQKANGRPIYLMQSGGLDSEVMICSFIDAGIPFKTISFRFPNGQNEHELEFVRHLSEAKQLDTQFYDIDMVNWVRASEAQDWFKLSNCWEIAMLPHMKLMHHIWFELGGMPVLGGGDVVIIKNQGQWMYSKYEYILAWYWFCAKMGIDAGVAFFQHTPEVTLAMLRQPEIQRAALGQDALANKVLPDLRAVKYRVYHRLWPELRRRIKFGGTELVHGMIVSVEQELRSKSARRFDGVWSIPYPDFVRAISP